MSRTEYIGARYVPLLADPVEWSPNKSYEALTIVLHQGNSFTSKQFVPVGIDITNTEFWAETGNYNAQIEEYRREAALALETASAAQLDIDTLLPEASFSAESTVKDYIDNNYNSKIYNITQIANLDKSGSTDISQSLVDAVNNLDAGSTVLFEQGVYRIDEAHLPSGFIYDFNNSVIVCNENKTSLNCVGSYKAVTRLASNNAPNSNTISVANASDFARGDLVVISDTTQLAHTSRDYYYKGFTSVIISVSGNSIVLSNSVPYELSAQTTTVTSYEPFTGKIKNIADFYTNEIAQNQCNGLRIECGCNVEIENVNLSHMVSHCIYSYHSYGTIIRNCHVNCGYIEIPQGTNITNPYFITIGSSTDTITEDCSGVNYWHCWTSGAQETPLHNVVKNCSFKSVAVPAISDHANAINTIIDGCYSTGYGIAAFGILTNCVNSYSHNNAFIRCEPHSDNRLATYFISNVITQIADNANLDVNVFQISITPQTSATDFYVDNLKMVNCSVNKVCNISINIRHYNNITLVNCTNILPFATTVSTESNENSTIRLIGCNFQCDNFAYQATSITSRVKKLIFESCSFFGDAEQDVLPRFDVLSDDADKPCTLILSNCNFEISTYRLLILRIRKNCNAYIYNCTTLAVANSILQSADNNNVRVFNSDIYLQNPSSIIEANSSRINGDYIAVGTTNNGVKYKLSTPVAFGAAEWVSW